MDAQNSGCRWSAGLTGRDEGSWPHSSSNCATLARHMRVWTLLFLAATLPAADLRVIYTGDLIGYARACAEE